MDTQAFTVIPVGHYLILAAILFCMGMAGVLVRRSALVVFMCIELMLNAANLTFLAFARERGDDIGHISAFFIIAVAAAEAAVGLAIVISLFRSRGTVNIEEVQSMKH
jgi:NADH-quinone oxidoreductase subunit K